MGRAPPKRDPAIVRIKAGRGSGTGRDYKPWLGIRDAGRLGNIHRVRGWKTGRVHVLFGGTELGVFYLSEWQDEIVDIREQYPLEREKTVAIAAELGIPHPMVVGTSFVYVMTTDLLLTVRTAQGIRHVAVDCKFSEDLEDPRVAEKLQIHKRYWELLGVPWHVVTENDLPAELVRNIEFLHPRRTLENLPLGTRDPERILEILEEQILATPARAVASICRELDQTHEHPPGLSLALVRFALASKRWHTDLSRCLDFTRPLVLESL